MEAIPSPITPYSLKGKHLEIITAALLLSGKLKVDAVTFFRGSPAIQVGLLGQLNQKGSNNNNSKSNALADFLAENGDLTIDISSLHFRRE